jgi:two-component system chemotaxis sensor kinase CheA
MLVAAQDGSEVDARATAAWRQRLQDWIVSPEPPASAAVSRGASESVYSISFRPHRELFRSGNDPLRLFMSLAALGGLEATVDAADLPAAAVFDPEQCYLAWRLTLTTAAPREEIEDILDWVSDCCDLDIRQDGVRSAGEPRIDHAPARAPDEASPDQRMEAAGGFRSNSLHVDTGKVDELVNLVGELVITQTMLKQIGANFDPDRLPQLQSALGQLERNTRDLQQRVMAIRMLPVSFAFGRFERLVRDLSQQLGKQVRLEITGEQSELDKTVIEKLIDPLTHLVRNALDHGIEAAEERVQNGKPATAVVKLHAEHKGGNIIVEVSDDGRGIDHEKVCAKARQLGLIGADAEPRGDELTRLIFLPGFSTAGSVSDLSGRGVGLDVVYRNITELGGALRVDTHPGQGTAFTIQLPLTLAIVDGMSVAVGEHTYIIPMSFILECLQPESRSIKTVAGHGCVVEVRGQYLPILDLGKLLGIASARGTEDGILLLLEANGKKFALLVDALLDQDQVVIKSLEANFRKVAYVAGATILGDGRVALILDANALMRVATH